MDDLNRLKAMLARCRVAAAVYEVVIYDRRADGAHVDELALVNGAKSLVDYADAHDRTIANVVSGTPIEETRITNAEEVYNRAIKTLNGLGYPLVI